MTRDALMLAPYYSLTRAAWVACVVTWDQVGELRRVEEPEGFQSYREALEASRFLMRVPLTG